MSRHKIDANFRSDFFSGDTPNCLPMVIVFHSDQPLYQGTAVRSGHLITASRKMGLTTKITGSVEEGKSVVELRKNGVPFWSPRQGCVDWKTGHCWHGHPKDGETVAPQLQQMTGPVG